jgi:hypothetical protein
MSHFSEFGNQSCLLVLLSHTPYVVRVEFLSWTTLLTKPRATKILSIHARPKFSIHERVPYYDVFTADYGVNQHKKRGVDDDSFILTFKLLS